MPDVIAERLFCIFASVISNQSNTSGKKRAGMGASTIGNIAANTPDRMDLEDLIKCYYVFKYQRNSELAQLCFEVIKLTKD